MTRSLALLAPVVVCLVVGGCTSSGGSSDGPTSDGPVRASGNEPFRLPTSEWEVGDPAEDALLSGTLRIDRRECLVVSGTPVLWPKGYAASRAEDGSVIIVDRDGVEVAQTGSHFAAGGGYGRPVESTPCPGPYPTTFVMQGAPLPTE